MSFEKLRVYQAAERLSDGVDQLIRLIPARFKSDIDELVRAVGSILYNIAEGYGIETPGRKVYHFEMARGSADESRAVLRRMVRRGAITEAKAVPLMVLARTIAKMLTGLINAVKKTA